MLQFIVLGYVPGTTFQLSFIDWLLFVATLCIALRLLSLLMAEILMRTLSELATCLYPYLKFRRRQDTFTVKLKLS